MSNATGSTLRIVVRPERNHIMTIRRLAEIRARHIIGLFRPTATRAPSGRPRRLYAVMRARIYMNTCCAATAVVVVVNPLRRRYDLSVSDGNMLILTPVNLYTR